MLKATLQIDQNKLLLLKKLKIIINDLNDEKIIGIFYKKEMRKPNQEEFRTEKVIMKKGSKLYVEWKGYHNSFHS